MNTSETKKSIEQVVKSFFKWPRSNFQPVFIGKAWIFLVAWYTYMHEDRWQLSRSCMFSKVPWSRTAEMETFSIPPSSVCIPETLALTFWLKREIPWAVGKISLGQHLAIHRPGWVCWICSLRSEFLVEKSSKNWMIGTVFSISLVSILRHTHLNKVYPFQILAWCVLKGVGHAHHFSCPWSVARKPRGVV